MCGQRCGSKGIFNAEECVGMGIFIKVVWLECSGVFCSGHVRRCAVFRMWLGEKYCVVD